MRVVLIDVGVALREGSLHFVNGDSSLFRQVWGYQAVAVVKVAHSGEVGSDVRVLHVIGLHRPLSEILLL
jgi:hypothetical protein